MILILNFTLNPNLNPHTNLNLILVLNLKHPSKLPFVAEEIWSMI